MNEYDEASEGWLLDRSEVDRSEFSRIIDRNGIEAAVSWLLDHWRATRNGRALETDSDELPF